MVSFHEKRRRLVAASICENRALETYVSQWDVVPRRLQLRLCDDLQFEHAGSNLAQKLISPCQVATGVFDFATIYNSNTPVATWQGEISFCAYNGGGWRKVLESVHHTATVADWYRNHGRHQIYAAGKKVRLVESLSSRPEPLV